jgi:FkbM family methyltransferase
MSMLDQAAVALLRASTLLPRGSMRLARLLAAARPSLKRYPARTKYGRLYCDVTESSCFALATSGEFTRWRADEDAIAAIPLDRSSVVLDIGANIGVMTRIFAKRAGHVHAFEPSPRALAMLRLNAPPNATVHPFALGEEEGVVEFAECEALDMSHIGEGDLQVPVRTVDSFGLTPDFIKIDVEGFEPQVLRGAAKTLAAGPIVMFEALTPDLLKECTSILVAANPGYLVKDMGSGENFLASPVPASMDPKDGRPVSS